uniref:Mitochondrial ribosomal protein S11 n=1 Tax=Ailuropoda melanoleuca TaxID=9646 RepID=A0A7N5JGH7_AILME
MQVVRKTGSWLLRAWAWPPTPSRVVAGAPASTIHTGAQQLQDAAAKQEIEEKVAAPAPSRSSFSIYPPVPGQESPLRWAGKKFEEIPIAHIKASYNNTQIQVVSAAHQPLARTSCGTEGFRNAKKGTGIAAQTAGIAAAVKTLSITHVFESQLRSRVRLALSRWSGTPAYARSTIAPALQRFTFCQTRSIS